MKNKILSTIKNKKLMIILPWFIIIIIVIVIFIVNSRKLTELEKVKVTEASTDVVNYIDEITSSPKDEGRYINFAIEYLYNKSDSTTFDVKDIIEVINEKFLLEYDEKKIIDIGISEEMLNKGIVFDSANNQFKYNINNTRLDIANKKIIKYELKKIKKINKNKFKVIYDKYLVENPYDIYNYYNEKNISKNEISEITQGELNKDDLSLITDYLKGEEKLSKIKNMINKNNIKNFGKIDGEISIIYVIKNEKLVIEKIDK